jgi:hypothetical protein
MNDGLKDWLPTVENPSAEAFFGVDRSMPPPVRFSRAYVPSTPSRLNILRTRLARWIAPWLYGDE